MPKTRRRREGNSGEGHERGRYAPVLLFSFPFFFFFYFGLDSNVSLDLQKTCARCWVWMTNTERCSNTTLTKQTRECDRVINNLSPPRHLFILRGWTRRRGAVHSSGIVFSTPATPYNCVAGAALKTARPLSAAVGTLDLLHQLGLFLSRVRGQATNETKQPLLTSGLTEWGRKEDWTH